MKDSLGNVQTILVLGGGSEIGLAIARKLAAPRKATVVLAGRHPEQLGPAVDALHDTGAGRVELIDFDADDTGSHETFVDKVTGLVGDIDVVVLAFGLLGNQESDEAGGEGAVRLAHTNYTGSISIGLAVARRLRDQGHGSLVVLSSVAGERARRSNFIYGSSKAGLDAFAQGLGHSLAGSGVNVIIVRPGFVDTKMTAGMKPAPLATTPEAVADATAAGLAAGKEIVWVPGALRFVFAVFRHLPTPLFRRLPL
jgi:decaprenylphospho-beta-D-erythro-pentofuranosid-2-ulose 2-reductase